MDVGQLTEGDEVTETEECLRRLDETQTLIREELGSINLKLQSVGEGMTRMTEHIDREELILRGDGTKESPGMVLRLDRLEQTEEVRRWSLRTMWIALVAMTGKLIFDLIGKT